MNRRRFIRTAVSIVAALPVFGPLMRGQSEKATSATLAEIGVIDGPPTFVVSGWINGSCGMFFQLTRLPLMKYSRCSHSS